MSTKLNFNNDFDKIYGTSYAKIKNKKYWKKELMEDD